MSRPSTRGESHPRTGAGEEVAEFVETLCSELSQPSAMAYDPDPGGWTLWSVAKDDDDDDDDDDNASGFSRAIVDVEWVEATGITFCCDTHRNRIISIQSDGRPYRFAGGRVGHRDGNQFQAQFSSPSGVAVDPATGAVIVADTGNHCIRRIYKGQVATLSGQPRQSGDKDGLGQWSSLNTPCGVAVDPLDGSVYVADSGNSKIKRVSPEGIVETFCGSGLAAHYDGVGAEAAFHRPFSLLCWRGRLLVADTGNHCLREVDLTTRRVRTLDGSPKVKGYRCGTSFGGEQEGSPPLLFSFPTGLCVRESDSAKPTDPGRSFDGGLEDESESAILWVADSRNSCVRQLTLADDPESHPEDEAVRARAQAQANAQVGKRVDKAERRATIERRRRFSSASSGSEPATSPPVFFLPPPEPALPTPLVGSDGGRASRVSFSDGDSRLDEEPLSPGSPQHQPPPFLQNSARASSPPRLSVAAGGTGIPRNSATQRRSTGSSSPSRSRRPSRLAPSLPKIKRTRVVRAATLIGGQEDAEGDDEEGGQSAMRSGCKNGSFAAATLEQPTGLAFNSMLQQLQVSDFFNNDVRKVHWPNGGPCVLDPLPPPPEPEESSSGSDSDDEDDEEEAEEEEEEEEEEDNDKEKAAVDIDEGVEIEACLLLAPATELMTQWLSRLLLAATMNSCGSGDDGIVAELSEDELRSLLLLLDEEDEDTRFRFCPSTLPSTRLSSPLFLPIPSLLSRLESGKRHASCLAMLGTCWSPAIEDNKVDRADAWDSAVAIEDSTDRSGACEAVVTTEVRRVDRSNACEAAVANEVNRVDITDACEATVVAIDACNFNALIKAMLGAGNLSM